MDKDPITGKPYPPEAIQRILFLTPKVHIYRIPPTLSTKGFNAATWTQNPADLVFTCRIRILETAIPPPSSSASPDASEQVSTTILLEDPSTGDLFAAAPYTSPAVVEQALDSSRFFTIRVVGEGGRKATLGLGFEERADAFDFGVCLQDVRKVLGLDGTPAAQRPAGKRSASGKAPMATPSALTSSDVKRDYSLKEGETIKVDLKGIRRNNNSGKDGDEIISRVSPFASTSSSSYSASNTGEGLGGIPFLPPPPGAAEVKAGRRRHQSSSTNELASMTVPQQKQLSAAELGFDDGEFGEFQ